MWYARLPSCSMKSLEAPSETRHFATKYGQRFFQFTVGGEIVSSKLDEVILEDSKTILYGKLE